MIKTLHVVATSYTTRGNRTIIEIYGRDKQGTSYTVLYEKFKPYCYMQYDPDILDALEKRFKNNLIDTEEVSLKHQMSNIECYKLTFLHPWNVKEAQNAFETKDHKFFSADILYPLRFWYDNDLGAFIEFEGETVINKDYSTDSVVVASRIERTDDRFRPKICTLSFDIETNSAWDNILCIDISTKHANGTYSEDKITGDLKGIIRQFEAIVLRIDPDAITGYSIHNFDFSKIKEVCKANKIKPPMIARNRSGLRKFNKDDKWWSLTGRIIADCWEHYKKIKKPKKERLNDMAMDLFGEQKLDVNPSNMDGEWAADPIKVIAYCQKDAELALRGLEEIQAIQSASDMAQITCIPLDKAVEGKTSQGIDSLLMRVADREGYAVPQGRHSNDEDKKKRKKIEGGYVHKVIHGLHNWVVVVDYRSLYPSIIIANNICYTTFVEDGSGEIVTPAHDLTGKNVTFTNKHVGLIPRLLQKLWKDRDYYKKKMRDATDKGWEKYFWRLQEAIKVLMNTAYGILASSFYRFTNPLIGAAITAFARERIKEIIETLENEGYTVIIGDTDSAFISSKYHSLDKCIEFGEYLAKRFSGDGYELEFEYVLKWVICHGAKKRYAGKIVYPEDRNGKKLVRGYETRRTDSFDELTDTMDEVFDLVLDGDKAKAVNVAQASVRRVKAGAVPIERVVISKSCKAFDQYKAPDTQSQVQAAKKLMEAGYPFTPGMKVSYIVTNGNTPQKVEPYIPERPCTPDWDYYTGRMATALSRITEIIGRSEKELTSGQVQKGLFDFETKI
ncbi:MAG: DNA polymerase II [Proteobacteria bacterium]|nr:DNA polymerase II [Pseudomonadota bacterium]